ncbi:MAG: hypothetical protein QM761_02215 [Pseudoxanthomonas sp.]
MVRSASTCRTAACDPRLDRGLRCAVFAGLALSLLLPLRSDWLGLNPLWLVGMPLSAWWALHRFRLPARRQAGAVRRRRPARQARRRKPLIGKGLARAA